MLKTSHPDPECNAVTVPYNTNCQDSPSSENVPWLWRKGPRDGPQSSGSKGQLTAPREHRAGSASPSMAAAQRGAASRCPHSSFPGMWAVGSLQQRAGSPQEPRLPYRLLSARRHTHRYAELGTPSLKSAARMQRIINIEIVSQIIYILLSHQHLAKRPQQQMLKVMTLNVC